ncbi:MAG TPA: energy transducer TonB [Candidatus Sulfotelmatobacter sp.]
MNKRNLFLAVALILMAGLAVAQNNSVSSAAERKVTMRVPPVYPELAKKMHIFGVVKIEAVVKPNGMVKSTRVLGGNPVLLEAAKDAVAKWKFEPAPSETTEVVQLAFEDQRRNQ